jgi:hypothetical protein
LFEDNEMEIETPLRTMKEARNMANSVWFFDILDFQFIHSVIQCIIFLQCTVGSLLRQIKWKHLFKISFSHSFTLYPVLLFIVFLQSIIPSLFIQIKLKQRSSNRTTNKWNYPKNPSNANQRL